MNSFAFGMPARRAAAALTATTLVGGSAVLFGALPAYATDGGAGKAGAVVLRTGLDVNLVKGNHIPLNATLNEVHAPGDAHETLLSAKVGERPVQLLSAKVATARATADEKQAVGYANLVDATARVPGLPGRIHVKQATSKATCEAGAQPRAESNILGTVQVMDKTAELKAAGTTTLKAAIGTVRLDLSKTSTTSHTAVGTALELNVSIAPKQPNVAAVKGKVTLIEATCESPKGGSGGDEPGPGQPSESTQPGQDQPGGGKPGTEPQGGKDKDNLAETGGSSATPYIAGGAAVLIAAGGGALVLTRRRRQNQG